MTVIKHRRGSAAEWTASDPVLAAGEKGVELDTGKFKLGDGATAWSALEYFIAESAVVAKVNDALADISPSPTELYQEAKA